MTIVRKNSKKEKKVKNNVTDKTKEMIFRYERLSPSLAVAKCPHCTLTTGFYMNDYEKGEILECESCRKNIRIDFQEKKF